MIAAAVLGVPWGRAIIISIIGNMLPIPIILLFIERVLESMKRGGPFKGFALWIEKKGKTQGEKIQSKYPKQLQLGLLIFVAIPFPGTGAWTGSLIAAFLGMQAKKSAPYICLGVLGAGAIMSFITYVIPWFIGRM
jgi:uncharacterized membrane protein